MWGGLFSLLGSMLKVFKSVTADKNLTKKFSIPNQGVANEEAGQEIMKSGIYLIRCDGNGKKYVGQSVNVNNRKRHHFSTLRRGKHHNPHLQSAYNKYGKESFEWSILGLYPVPLLDYFELAWLELYDCTTPRGFNLMGGGGSIHTRSEETCRKLSEIAKNRTPEQLRKMADGQRGRKLSPEHRKKLSKTHKGKPWSKARREAQNKRQRLGKKNKPKAISARIKEVVDG